MSKDIQSLKATLKKNAEEPDKKPIIDDLSCFPDAATALELEEEEDEDLLIEFGLVAPTLTVVAEVIKCRNHGKKKWVNLTVEWNNIEDFVYELKIEEIDAGDETENGEFKETNGPQFTFKRLDFQTTYNIFIRAKYGDLTGEWSDPPLEYTTMDPDAIPGPVNVSMSFEDREKTKGHKFTCVVSWDELQLGSCDDKDVDDYIIQLWRWDPITSSFVGTEPVRKVIVASKDEDAGDRAKARIYPVNKKYWYKARVRARVNHVKGEWSAYTDPGSPLDTTAPATPEHVRIRRSVNGILTTWDIPTEWISAAGTVSTSGTTMTGVDTWFEYELLPGIDVMVGNDIRTVATVTDQTTCTVTQAFSQSYTDVPYSYDNTYDEIDHAIVQIATDKNFNDIVDRDRWVHAEKKKFRVEDSDQLYFTRVALVDSSGNKSAYINAIKADGGNSLEGVDAEGVKPKNLGENPPFSVGGTLEVKQYKHRWYADQDYTLKSVSASVGTMPTGSAVTVNVQLNGEDIFADENRPSISPGGDNRDRSSLFKNSKDTMDDGDYLTISVDEVGSTTAGEDLTVQVRMERID